MRLVLTTLVLAGVAMSAPAHAAHCYQIALKDQFDATIPVNPPKIGIMVGDATIIEEPFPEHQGRQPVARAECPASLVASIQATFNESCVGDDIRKKVAEANGVSIELVTQRCADMDAALKNKDGDRYRALDEKIAPKKPDAAPKKPAGK